ncbi:MAG TPA: carbohydrate kinase [Terrimesophilobacter sp.]|nr:carbohydrate kinase [Terrimesophilobacter sp.]HRP99100.1 carbohydrate kinase [Terrimesophilobacter sp.]
MSTISDHILVIGESLIDRVASGGPEVEHVGGSPANVAHGLGRLGYPVTLLTQFGADRRGRMIEEHLRDSVDIVQGGYPDTPTSSALVTVDADGIPSYVFDLTWDVSFPDAISPALVHTGSLGAYLEPGCHEVVRIIRNHARDATITLDPNLRPHIMERDTAASRLDGFVPMADVIKVSSEDLAWLHPGTNPEVIVHQWLSAGVKLVVLTRGAKGAEAWTADAHSAVPASRVQVVDTVGAGDVFMAGLIDALCTLTPTEQGRLANPADLDPDQLHVVLSHAARAAGIAVTHAGAHPPTRDELGWIAQG